LTKPALGQKATFDHVQAMSALPPITDIGGRISNGVSGHAAANSRESGDDPFLRGAVRIANDQCDRLANIRHLLVGESQD